MYEVGRDLLLAGVVMFCLGAAFLPSGKRLGTAVGMSIGAILAALGGILIAAS